MSIVGLHRWWLPGVFAAGLCGVLSQGAEPLDKDAPKKLDKAAPVSPPPASILDPNAKPIDLAASLKLAGVDNPEILLARQRVVEAVALRQLAAAQILPNLNVGTSFDSHTGNLQQSNGNILSVNRTALYAGMGSYAVGAGTVNIPGLLLQGNLTEGIFGYLTARQLVHQREFESLAVRNDVLLQVATGYVDLLYAEGHLAVVAADPRRRGGGGAGDGGVCGERPGSACGRRPSGGGPGRARRGLFECGKRGAVRLGSPGPGAEPGPVGSPVRDRRLGGAGTPCPGPSRCRN